MGANPALNTVFEALNEAHESLLSQTRRQQEAILKGSAEDLESILEEIDSQVQRITEIENQRARIVSDLAKANGILPDRLRLGDVLSWVSPEEARELEQLGDELRKTLDQIRDVGETNAFFLRRNLDWIEDVFSVLTGEPTGGPNYTHLGTEAERTRTPVLVNRTV